MSDKIKLKLKHVDGVAGIDPDSYSFGDDPFRCREELQRLFVSYETNFGFNHHNELYYVPDNDSQCDSVKNFISDFQKQSKIPSKHRIEIKVLNIVNYFSEVDIEYFGDSFEKFLYIKLNKFWKAELRFSLLTALLREGRRYNGKNLMSVIGRNSSYFRNKRSSKALKLFMAGKHNIKNIGVFNIYEGDDEYDMGWIDYFSNVDPDEVMSKPKKVLYRK